MGRSNRLKSYYSKKDASNYRNDNYYRSMVEVMNQIRRIKIVKKFFSKYLVPRAKVLDLGCGNGNDIIHLNEEFGGIVDKFVGVDLAKKLIAQLNAMKIKKCKFIEGDVESIDLKEKFDILLSLETAEHLENFDRYLDVIKKHMKPNGYLILSTPNSKYLLRDLYKLLTKIIRRDLKSVGEIKARIASGGEDQGIREHINVMSFGELKSKLEKHNLYIIDKERTMLLFGGKYADRFFGLLGLLDQILPKKLTCLGVINVIVAKLK